jgi:hypothetical protein
MRLSARLRRAFYWVVLVSTAQASDDVCAAGVTRELQTFPRADGAARLLSRAYFHALPPEAESDDFFPPPIREPRSCGAAANAEPQCESASAITKDNASMHSEFDSYDPDLIL